MSSKIVKIAGAKPVDEFEITIGQAIIDLENSVPELKKELRPLSITGAKEVSYRRAHGNARAM
jgi:small subunit ribosomal protein S7e